MNRWFAGIEHLFYCLTVDNRLTAAAIAAKACVDDFLAEAIPEAKLALIRQHQADGRTGGSDA